jgi:hypothetical protein
MVRVKTRGPGTLNIFEPIINEETFLRLAPMHGCRQHIDLPLGLLVAALKGQDGSFCYLIKVMKPIEIMPVFSIRIGTDDEGPPCLDLRDKRKHVVLQLKVTIPRIVKMAPWRFGSKTGAQIVKQLVNRG